MSRMRTSFKASILISKNSAADVRLPALAQLFDLFLLCALRIQARDASAFGAGGFIDDGVDERGLLRADGFFHCLLQPGRGRGGAAHAPPDPPPLFLDRPPPETTGCPTTPPTP